jgi:hypothetical protein
MHAERALRRPGVKLRLDPRWRLGVLFMQRLRMTAAVLTRYSAFPQSLIV